MISDADLIDGRGIINEAFMYVYNEEARTEESQKNGKFDSSKDKRLGYISIDGSGNVSLTSMPVSSGSSKVNLVWNIRLIISGVCQGQMMHH